MGGMVACTREIYERVGGLESRMEIYGGEDIDFVQRMRWSGSRVIWLDEPDAGIFHVWHPSSRTIAERDPATRETVERNRSILLEDRTIVRNLQRPRSHPVATVAIATHDRCALLKEAITSVLLSSVENIEVLIVDDGSVDDTAEMVKGIDDPRVRYVKKEHAGVPAARNLAVAEAKADYIVVHDDDDLMLPWRIEAHFEKLTAAVHGTYGGWVDFGDETGELTAVPGKEFSPAALMHAGSVLLHPTLMLDKRVYERFPYNERMLAGSDYNLVMRLASAGIVLDHTGYFHILRRFHDANLTRTTYDLQQESARRTTNLFMRGYNKTETENARKAAREVKTVDCVGADDLYRNVAPYLPDSLVSRSATIVISDEEKDRGPELQSLLEASSDDLVWEELENGSVEDDDPGRRLGLSGLSWPTLLSLKGFDLRLTALPRALGDEASESDDFDPASIFPELVARIDRSALTSSPACAVWFVPAGGELMEWFGDHHGVTQVVADERRRYLVRVAGHPSIRDAVDALLAAEDPRGVGRFALEVERR
jgi:glycosyltransferase involved in cell wall biosynthesis